MEGTLALGVFFCVFFLCFKPQHRAAPVSLQSDIAMVRDNRGRTEGQLGCSAEGSVLQGTPKAKSSLDSAPPLRTQLSVQGTAADSAGHSISFIKSTSFSVRRLILDSFLSRQSDNIR